jgi:hypothetical protein
MPRQNRWSEAGRGTGQLEDVPRPARRGVVEGLEGALCTRRTYPVQPAGWQ